MSFFLQRLQVLVAAVLTDVKYAWRSFVFVGFGAVVFSVMFSACSVCNAGGGPENVFLLVNSTSQDSLTLANHYQSLRNIPTQNVFYLPYKASKGGVTGETFRRMILLPAFAEIKKRKLENQIDYLVYSCDFPWRVTFTADFPGVKFPRSLPPRGSLTGLTYLHEFMSEKKKEVISPNANWYFKDSLHGTTVSRAFRSQYRWAPGGKRSGKQGLNYMISSMLGVTDGRGNKVSEIINCLRLAKKADGRKPKGTVYFFKHGGPRSTPRHDRFVAATAQLRQAGVNAKVYEGKFPQNKGSIAGLTCGTAYADLGASGCRFLPGAFCDNLTSYGAVFSIRKIKIDQKTGKKRKEQVNTADFIRHGATAACGTVFEPTNMWQKFPRPSVHVHYANGCSLGESFYQSVSGPYQQLLVGDPLCQPWADFPVVTVDGISAGATLRGQVEITPATGDPKKPIREYELFVDGVRTQRCKPGKQFLLDTTKLRDGQHELRVIARDATPIETQGRLILDVAVKNGRDAISLTTKRQKFSLASKHIRVDVRSTAEAPVELFFNDLNLGSLPTGSGTLRVETAKLGSGPVKLFAKSEGVQSKPLLLDIAAR